MFRDTAYLPSVGSPCVWELLTMRATDNESWHSLLTPHLCYVSSSSLFILKEVLKGGYTQVAAREAEVDSIE